MVEIYVRGGVAIVFPGGLVCFGVLRGYSQDGGIAEGAVEAAVGGGVTSF
jgi:hypothetical protein